MVWHWHLCVLCCYRYREIKVFNYLAPNGVAIEGHWGMSFYKPTQLLKNSAKMHQNTSFLHQNSENFPWRGTVPNPYLTSYVPPLQLDPGYATALPLIFSKL